MDAPATPLSPPRDSHGPSRSDGRQARELRRVSGQRRRGHARGDEQARAAAPRGQLPVQPALQEVRVLLGSVAGGERPRPAVAHPFAHGRVLRGRRRGAHVRLRGDVSLPRARAPRHRPEEPRLPALGDHEWGADPAGGRRVARGLRLRPAHVLDRRGDRRDDGQASRGEPRQGPPRAPPHPRREGAAQVRVSPDRRELRGAERQLPRAAGTGAPARSRSGSTSWASTRSTTSSRRPALTGPTTNRSA